jgi:DNA-binding NarL/FixJ family response regulator
MTQVRIMLVDDHAVVRSGIRRLLEQNPSFMVVAEAESGESAYQQFGEQLPDVAVMDLTMPGMGGMESLRRIIARYPTARILVLSMHEQAAFASQALKAGAKGYLSKSSLAQELVNALQTIGQGQTYISPDMAKKIALQSLQGDGDPMQLLSAREFEIFRLLAEGQEVDSIAHDLKISSKTVANYQTAIKQKLGINTPVELVRMAIRFGLIES